MSEEFSEDLGMLRRAIEEPVPQMLLAEVASDNHAQKIAAQIRNWCEPSREFAEVAFDANNNNAWQLWGKCRDATKEWQDSDLPGLLLLTDTTVPDARTIHHDSDLSTSVGFWRAMNLLREKWDSLPIQIIFLVTSQQYFLFTTEADHLKRWIPLKLHLPDENVKPQPSRLIGGALLRAEDISADLFSDDNLDDKDRATEQWDSLREREILAVGRGEKSQTLAQRHWLPLLAAAITLEKWQDAARYEEALSSVNLPLSSQLRWLRLHAFLEYRTGHVEEALATAQHRWKLAKEQGSQWDKTSALWMLWYLHQEEKHWDDLEKVANQALQINPRQINFLAAYAQFLHDVRHDYDRAERFYKLALEVNSKHFGLLNNYAVFLNHVRLDYDRAEKFYKRAIDIAPQHSIALGNYAGFLARVRSDHTRAEKVFERAIEADPNNAITLKNYAMFLTKVRHDYDRAEELYKRAIEVEPQNSDYLSNFAIFLCQVRRDFEEASEYFHKAIEMAPNEPQYVVNYAALALIEGNIEEGLSSLNKAAVMEDLTDAQKVGVALHRYIHFPHETPNPLIQLKNLLQAGLRAENWTFDLNIERAQKDGHPNVTLLKALAKVISENANLASLDTFPEWVNA